MRLLPIWLFLGLGPAISAFAFDGRLEYHDGRPVQYAEVSILGVAGLAHTDADGRFTWSPDPAVPFQVFVLLPGNRYVAPVHVESLPAEGVLVLTVEAVVQETVTVTSGATPNIEAPPAAGMSVIPHEDIAERQPARLTDVLENIPGASRLSDLHAGVPSLRGLARGRTLILLDGARVTTERRAGPSATFLDPMFLQAVEVVRGPGSVAYGSDAFGGVIHARSKDVAPNAPLRFRLQSSLGLGVPQLGGGLEMAKGFAKGGVLFQARYRGFEDYRSPEGDVANSDASNGGFLMRGNHRLGPGKLTMGWQSHLGRGTGRPTTNSELDTIRYPEEDSHRLNIEYELDPKAGFTLIDLQGFWGKYRLVTDRRRFDLETFQQSDVDAKDFSLRARAIRPLGRARLEVGAEVNGRYGLVGEVLDDVFDDSGGLVSTDENLAIEDARQVATAAYGSAEWLVAPRLSLSTGARLGRVATRNRGGFFGDRDTSHLANSFFGSAKVTLALGVSLTGQLSRGFRDPSLSDRYFAGISGRGFVTGNPDLMPESATQWDFALRESNGDVRWTIFAYRYMFHDLIERYEESDGLFFFRNRGEATLTGLEFELQANVAKTYYVELAAQTSRGIADDTNPLDDVPTTNLSVELRRDFGARYYGQVRVAVFAQDERAGPTERPVGSFAFMDLGLGVRIRDGLRLRLSLDNLFDQSYPISADARSVRAPGRSLQATIVAEF